MLDAGKVILYHSSSNAIGRRPLAAHAPSGGGHGHPGHHHHHDHGHAHAAAGSSAMVSALTMSAGARLAVACGLSAVLWLLVLWAMG